MGSNKAWNQLAIISYLLVFISFFNIESMKRSSLDTLLPLSDNKLDGKKEKTLENTASKVGEFMKGVMSLFGNNKGINSKFVLDNLLLTTINYFVVQYCIKIKTFDIHSFFF